MSWFRRPLLKQLQEHVNQYASIKLGAGWNFMLTIVTPISLLAALLLTLNSIFTEGYGGYPIEILLPIGGGVVAIFVFCAVVFSHLKDNGPEEK